MVDTPSSYLVDENDAIEECAIVRYCRISMQGIEILVFSPDAGILMVHDRWMRNLLLAVCFWCSLPSLIGSQLRAADAVSSLDPQLASLIAADEARILAMTKPDRDRLDAILSNELHYAHSTGVVDTKSTIMDSLLASRIRYLSFEYVERKFSFPTPGMALMSGQTRIKVETGTGTVDGLFCFLAVWRKENDVWRFLAWQSAKLPVPKE